MKKFFLLVEPLLKPPILLVVYVLWESVLGRCLVLDFHKKIRSGLQEFCLANRKSTCGRTFPSAREELICSISSLIWIREITQARLYGRVSFLAPWSWHSQMTTNTMPWEQIEERPWVSDWQIFLFIDYFTLQTKSWTKLTRCLLHITWKCIELFP